jgi:Domain of unknown function (DUF4202)
MVAPSERLAAVVRDIDLANSGDPRRVLVDGIEKAYEVVYSERLSERLAKMYPDASELLRIAARSQHIRRWDIPRTRYPDGRSGYNAWRNACQQYHAGLIAEILARHGYAAAEIEHVAKLIKKQQLKKDPESQALENVVDVVFVEHYIDDFLARHRDYDEDKVVDIIAKILRKMSAKGHAEVLALALRPKLRALIGKAMAREAAPSDLAEAVGRDRRRRPRS